MSKRIPMKEGVIYRPRKPFPYSTLYKLMQFCLENDLRFGQALANATPQIDLYYIEDDQLERRIKEYIANNSISKG